MEEEWIPEQEQEQAASPSRSPPVLTTWCKASTDPRLVHTDFLLWLGEYVLTSWCNWRKDEH